MAKIELTPRRLNAIKNSAKGVVPSFLKSGVTKATRPIPYAQRKEKRPAPLAHRQMLKGTGKMTDLEVAKLQYSRAQKRK